VIETTTKYVTTVDNLPAAWAFVMDHLDALGPDPEVHIRPVWIMSVAEAMDERDERPAREFEVAVSGMVQADA
jgi:hypothetical protein